jgi:SAM-dependent methyltransferase
MDDSSVKTIASNGPRRVGIEFRKCIARWERDGLLQRYLSGQHILDIGFRGGDADAVPVTETAIGIGLDYPGYDGTRLPFEDETQDAVFASAVLEHIPNYKQVLADWYRVTKVGGYLIIFVPNRYLYEMRPDLPGRWNGDHRRFYTAGSLLAELEEALPANGFRVRHLLDDDELFDYDRQPGSRLRGHYQIELVAQKIAVPAYSERLVYSAHLRSAIEHYDKAIIEYIDHVAVHEEAGPYFAELLGTPNYFTPWRRLQDYYVFNPPSGRTVSLTVDQLRNIVTPLVAKISVDTASYVKTYKDLGAVADPTRHWRVHGYFEGRMGSYFEFLVDMG